MITVQDSINPSAQAQSKAGVLQVLELRGPGRSSGVPNLSATLASATNLQFSLNGGVSARNVHQTLDNQLFPLGPVGRTATFVATGFAPTQAQVDSLFSIPAQTGSNNAGLTVPIGASLQVTVQGGSQSTFGTTAAHLYAVTGVPIAGAIKFETSSDGVTWTDKGTFDYASNAALGMAALSIRSKSNGFSPIQRFTITATTVAIVVGTLGLVSYAQPCLFNLMSKLGNQAHYGPFNHTNAAAIEKKNATQTLGVTRWRYGQSTADNFEVDRHNSSGVKIDTPLLVDGATGAITLSAALTTGGPIKPGNFTVATLPSAAIAGQIAYASNGRVGAELLTAGTGCPVYSKGGLWLKFDLNTQVQA